MSTLIGSLTVKNILFLTTSLSWLNLSAWRSWAGLGRFLRRDSWSLKLGLHLFPPEVAQVHKLLPWRPNLVKGSEKSEYFEAYRISHIEGVFKMWKSCCWATIDLRVVSFSQAEYCVCPCFTLLSVSVLKTFPCPFDRTKTKASRFWLGFCPVFWSRKQTLLGFHKLHNRIVTQQRKKIQSNSSQLPLLIFQLISVRLHQL